MGGLGTILGGALSGFGAGIAKQGEMDYETRRNLALENVRNQNQQSNIKMTADEARVTQESGAKLDDWKSARQNARTTTSTIKINEVQAENEKALAKFRSTLKITEDQSAAATDLAKSLAESNQTVGEMRVAADGSIWAYSKTGKPLGNSKPGKFNPPATSGAAAGGSILDRAGGTTATQPATPGAKVSTSNW